MASLRTHKTNQSLLLQVIVFTVPLLFTNLFQQAYQVLDNIIAGKFAGELTLAAVGATNYLTSLVNNLLIGVAIGVSTAIAQMEGEQDHHATHRAVHTAMTVSILGGLGLGLIGILICQPALMLMQTPTSILGNSVVYMRVNFSGLVFMSVYNFGTAILRAKGDTTRPLLFLFLSGGVKVALNLLFVAVFKWGAAALALSTVLSQLLSAALVVRALIKEDETFGLRLRELKIHSVELGRILRCGIPIGLQSGALAFSNVILQSSINSFGDMVVAGASAGLTFNSLFYSLQTSMSHTATIFCGRSFGSRDYVRIKRSLLDCSLLVMIVGAITAVICYPTAEKLVGLFVSDPVAVSSGAELVRLLCLTYWLSGLMEVVSGGLRAINKAAYAMVVTVVCLCVVRIVWVHTYFAGHRGLGILFYSYPLSWAATLSVSLLLFGIFFKRLKKSNL